MTGVTLTAAGAEAALVLSVLHQAAFLPRRERFWTALEIRDLLTLPGVQVVVAGDEIPLGFVMVQTVAGEAEILTLGVHPEARRRGVGGALLDGAMAEARRRGALTLFLEVAADNPPALGLYHSRGFAVRGRRLRYYSRSDGTTADALILGRVLN